MERDNFIGGIAMRRKVVAGNWKMNTTPAEGVELVREIQGLLRGATLGVEVMVFPPFTHMEAVRHALGEGIVLGAQDCSAYSSGAYTGEVSVEMLVAVGCRSVMVGHSERRKYHGEGDEMLSKKIGLALDAGLEVMFCVGEPEAVRAQGEDSAWRYVEQQLGVLIGFKGRLSGKLKVAYEPVWAIGTGRTASAHDAGWMCSCVEGWLEQNVGEGGDALPVLYGGSCNAKNARELFLQPGVSGGLIGGASLKAADFAEIVRSF